MPSAQSTLSGPISPNSNTTPTVATDGHGNVGGGTESSSKFRRFLKKFGRRPSDEAAHHYDGREEAGTATSNGLDKPAAATGTVRSSKGSKGSKPSTPKGKRSDSLAGRFFPSSSSSNAQNGSHAATQNGSSAGRPPQPSTTAASNTLKSGFSGTNVKGLANTLTLPTGHGTPPPQLDGVPRYDPIATSDLLSSSGVQVAAAPIAIPSESRGQTQHRNGAVATEDAGHLSNGKTQDIREQNMEEQQSHLEEAGARPQAELSGKQVAGDVLSQQSSYGSSRSRTAPSFDNDSTHGARVRDSVDNQTMDTGKSRASTKPTTLMSMDTRETAPGGSSTYAPMVAQIAQHRHGDVTPNQHRQAASGSGGGVATSVIQFASAPPMGRTASGTIVQLPGQDEPAEDVPYTNVPSLSRPHPSNNPHPSGVPADNASVLTLASSTAAASIVGGGASSSRGHQSHAAPSFGGARSIGGSLMGERRNSSDTYASLKALPPLSRRGSDSSTRTGRSIAASATGRSSAQAMMGAAAISGAGVTGAAGPGAPADRISIHRTPSQRTIATQLSIPLSTSNVALAFAGQADPHTDASGGGGGGHLSVGAPAPTSALGSSPLAVPTTIDTMDVHRSGIPPTSTHTGGVSEVATSINASQSNGGAEIDADEH